MEFSSVNTIWVLLGAALVFFMQAGFSMCEAGFTRAKNTGNILMKNLMDFCIGTPCFWLVGFGIMFGAEAIPVKRVPSFEESDGTTPKFTKIEIICKESKFEALKTAMLELGITGMTMSHVLGCGIQKGKPEYYRGVEVEPTLLPKIQLDIVVSKVPVRSVIETAKKVLYTGHIGDGKIFVYDVENVVKVRTGEEGYDALQDVE